MSNPTALVEQFDGDAGAFSVVDPERYDDGLWLERAGTNLVLNPAAVTDTTGWGINDANVPIERVTSLPAPLPGELAELVTTGFRMHATATSAVFAVANIGLTLTAAAYTYSGYFYIPASYTGAAPRLRRGDFGSATGDDFEAANLFLRDQWQELDITFTPNAGDLVGDLRVQIGGTINSGDEFWFACMQAEVGSYASSFILSSLGDGYSSSPSPHSRAASSASIPTAGILSPVSGAIAARITPTIETGVEEIWGACGVKGAGTDHVQWGRDSTKHPFVEWSSNDAAYERLTSTHTLDAETGCFLYLDWTGTDISLQVDDQTIETDTRDAVEDDFSTGDLTLQASAGGVVYGELATFSEPLTSAQIATLEARQAWSMGTLSESPYSRIRSQFELRPY